MDMIQLKLANRRTPYVLRQIYIEEAKLDEYKRRNPDAHTPDRIMLPLEGTFIPLEDIFNLTNDLNHLT